MNLCKGCRNLININDCESIDCEAHFYSVKEKSKCKSYLNMECNNKKKIEKNIKVVTEMYLEDEEDLLIG